MDQRAGRCRSRGSPCRPSRRCSRAVRHVVAVVGAAAAGLAAVVRGDCGLPREWLKSTVPFGGFPWGVVGFSQTDGPLLAIAQLGGAPLLSFAVALDRIQFGGNHSRDREVVASRPREPDRGAAGGGGARRCASPSVAADHRMAWPHVRQSGVGAGDDPAITVAAVQGNVPRLGLEFNAQRRAVLDNHVRETVRLAEDVREAGRRSRWWSSGRRTPPTSIRWPIRTPAAEISAGGGGDRRADPGRWRGRGPRLQPRQPGVDELGDRVESRNRPGRSPRQADRPAVRRVPAVARLLPPSVVVRRPGRLLRARQRQRGGARRRACPSG